MANYFKINGSFSNNVRDPDSFRYIPPPRYGFQGTYKAVVGEFETVICSWTNVPVADYPGFINELWWRINDTEGQRVVCFIPPFGTVPYRAVYGIPQLPEFTFQEGLFNASVTITHVSGNA